MAQQPPATPPPPPPAGYGPPAGPGPGARPPGVTPAAVFLIITGVLWGLFGIIMTIGGGALAGSFGGAGGAVIVIGLLFVALGVFDVIGGIKVLALRAGWRIAGIVLTAVGTLISVLFLIGSFQGEEEFQIDPNTFEFTTVSSGPNVGGLIFALLFLAMNVITLIMLVRSGSAFVRQQ